MQCGVAMGLSLRVFQILTSHSLTLCLFSACAPGHDACVQFVLPAKLWISVDGRECEKMQKNDVKRHSGLRSPQTLGSCASGFLSSALNES